MIENLIHLVESHAADLIVHNPDVPDRFNQDAIHASAASIEETLKNSLKSGDVSSLLSLLGGKSSTTDHPLVGQMVESLQNKLSTQFDVAPQSAKSIAAALIPQILASLVQKTNNPQDPSFSLEGIFHHLTDGRSQGTDLSSLVEKLDMNGDGQVNLQDVVAKFTGSSMLSSLVGKVFG